MSTEAKDSIRTDLAGRLRDGRKLAREGHKAGDAAKLGNLRAGNTGMMSVDGDFAGSCPRVAHLRSLGIDVEEPTDDKIIMFQMGTANEDVVYGDLIKTKAADEVILREEEIPIEWLTSNGTKVTGRPDMVVCKLEYTGERVFLTAGVDLSKLTATPGVITYYGEPPTVLAPKTIPVFGIEIKGVFSVWTSREVLFDGSPKLTNLLQAGHYSWKLGIPFRLMYKQYANQAVPQWAGKFFPKKGEKHSEHIEYNEKGEIKNIKPFEIVYELEWDSSSRKHLRYRREGQAEWTKTLVTQADIERFYEHTSQMASTKKLGSRPMTIDALGNEKGYSNCKYCPLESVCDLTEDKGYDKWLTAVKKELGK